MQPIEITSRGRVLRGMHYEGGGQGTVLLPHGFSSTRTGPGQLFVTFARAGHGESDGAFRDVTVPDEIEQLSAMLDLAPGGAHLAGHSLGAMELARLAGRRPDNVLSLTLWAAATESKDQAEDGLVMGKRMQDGPDGAYEDIGGQALGPSDACAGKTVPRTVFLSRLPFCTEFRRSSKACGLDGVRLVIGDAHTGLKAVIGRVFGATWQKVPRSRDAQRAGASVARPAWHEAALHDPIERLDKELKRRAGVVGTFPDAASIMRLICAVPFERNDEQQTLSCDTMVEAFAPIDTEEIDPFPTMTTKAA